MRTVVGQERYRWRIAGAIGKALFANIGLLSKLCDVSDRSLSDVNVARQLGW